MKDMFENIIAIKQFFSLIYVPYQNKNYTKSILSTYRPFTCICCEGVAALKYQKQPDFWYLVADHVGQINKHT